MLRGVSFTVGPGQTTAIVGSTGAGKTTLVNLIPRLFDVTERRRPRRRRRRARPRRGAAVEPHRRRPADRLPVQRHDRQQPALRAARRRPTTRCGTPSRWPRPPTSCGRCRTVCEAPVAQGGTNFSGGQRQRLAIARALIRRPEIYLFDDAFSALDLGTDARLRAALAPRTRDAAVIIVAQRVSTIIGADEIVVLEDGARRRHRPPRRAARRRARPTSRSSSRRRRGGGVSDDGQSETAAPPLGGAAAGGRRRRPAPRADGQPRRADREGGPLPLVAAAASSPGCGPTASVSLLVVAPVRGQRRR